MLNRISILLFSAILFTACASEGEICDCWKELVTKEGDRTMSAGCEYILEMKREEIAAEAGPACVDEINKLLFDENEVEINEEIDEDALFEQVD